MSGEKASSSVKVRNVVLDSGPIIKGHALNMHIIAEKIFTIPEVITEIRDSKSRDMLERMPFLEIREPSQAAIKAVCDFARQTGDLAALSVTDLKLCALTYALEAELVGTSHIRTEPVAVKVSVGSKSRKNQKSETATEASTAVSELGDEVQDTTPNDGDVHAAVDSAEAETEEHEDDLEEDAAEHEEDAHEDGNENENGDDTEAAHGDEVTEAHVEDIAVHLEETKITDESSTAVEVDAESQQTESDRPTATKQQQETSATPAQDVVAPQHAGPTQVGPGGNSRFISIKGRYGASGGMTEADDDGEGWINPSNVTECVASGRGMMGGQLTTGNRKSRKPRIATVACCTTDFSMQNLLMRMNLQICAVDGVRVTQVKQWVLRCNGCYTIHFELNRMFCSKCGAHHLFRVSSSIDSRTGELRLHLKKNYQYDTSGMRYNLPKPGKHGRYEGDLLLREDQLLYGVWRQKSRQAAKALKSSFGEDITADVGLNLKAQAQLQHGLGKKNPNTQRGRERRGKKKR